MSSLTLQKLLYRCLYMGWTVEPTIGLGLCMLLQDKNLKQKDKEARL